MASVRPVVLISLLLSLAMTGWALQSPLEDGKRAYFEGRFEESIRLLEPLLASLSDTSQLRDTTFFLGLNRLALGDTPQGRSYFESTVRHDPTYEPSDDLFSPDVVRIYREVREGMTGRVRIESTPSGAEVTIGNQMVGRTPYEGTALAGELIVQLELAGYGREERPVTVVTGESGSVNVNLRRTTGPTTTTDDEPKGGLSGKTIGILAGVGGGAAVAIAAASGGGSDGGTSPTPTTSTQATRGSFSAFINPDPVSSETSTNPNFRFLARFNVNIAETAGVGGNVDFINVRLTDGGSGGQINPVNYGAGDVIANAGTNRVEASSQLRVPLGIIYTFASGGSAGTISAEVQVTDDRGNRQTLSANATLR